MGVPLEGPVYTTTVPPGNPDFYVVAETAHIRSVEDVVTDLGSSEDNGISYNEAARRLEHYGYNVLKGEKRVSALHVLLKQLANAFSIILIAAMALSFGVGDFVEGAVIGAVVVINATVGFLQEYRADRTMDSLRQLSSPTALVVRDGESRHISAKDVVPGDVVLIKTGDVVPCDLRLLMVSNLEVSEQTLTGESAPVVKTTVPFQMQHAKMPIGDRTNLCYSSTVVTKGRGSGVTIGTGMHTQIGSIAGSINVKKKDTRRDGEMYIPLWKQIYERIMKTLGFRAGTPLEIKLNKLAYVLLLCAAFAVIIVFSVARFRVNHEVILYAIAAALSILPQSLIAVLSLTMAVGTRRMASEHVIVRKLDALENLGGVTDICSDKTGTLTLGQMSVIKFWVAGDPEEIVELTAQITSNALDSSGTVVRDDGSELNINNIGEGISQAVRCAALCNVATIHRNLRNEWKSTGDPTEVALQVFAMRVNLGRPALTVHGLPGNEKLGDGEITVNAENISLQEKDVPLSFALRVEFPFSSDTKLMTTIYYNNSLGQHIAFTKGAAEKVLNLSISYIPHPESEPHISQPLTDEKRQKFIRKAEEFAEQGLRVISLAHRVLQESGLAVDPQREDIERDMTFLALAGIRDPPRPETRDAVRACKRAGIVVHMLTGDHLITAKAIAQAVGILPLEAPPEAVMNASEFSELTDAEIDALSELPLVVARCAPETKVRMIYAGTRRGKHMAMTGDGVNDSPALKLAPVGIAMGMSGSDVAKDASDLVLTDDNFDSIRVAVGEGRRSFVNMQRFVLYLLATNVAEVILLIVGLSFVDRDHNSVFPLSAIAILWTNLITGSSPAFGLGLEPAEHNIMLRPPHSVKIGLFTWPIIFDCFAYGIVMGATCLGNFVIVVYGANDGELGTGCNRNYSYVCRKVFKARSTTFITLLFETLLFAFELKSFDRSMFALTPGKPFYKDLWANRVLFWSVIGGMISAFLPVYIPGFNTVVFAQGAIGWELSIAVGMSIVFIVWCEVWKIIRRRLYRRWEPETMYDPHDE